MNHKLLLDYELATAQNGFVVRAMLKLEGQAPADVGRAPLNLALVLDRSGSMGGEKLDAAKDAVRFLLRRLSPDDSVALVAYDDIVDTLGTTAEGASITDLARLAGGIDAGSTTNLSGGWLRGRELVARAKREHRMNRVVLLTDGLANVGISNPDQLTGLAATAKRGGVTTTTIGFGADYDEALLRAMADAGGGNTWYIERPDQAPGVFEAEVEGLLSLAAQNVTVEIRPGAGARFVRVWHDYPVHVANGAGRVEIGDIYGREPKTILAELFVPALLHDGDVDIGEVAIDAHVLTADGGVDHQHLTLPIRSPLSPAGNVEPEVRHEMLLVRAARAREESLRRGDAGDVAGATRVLREMAEELAAAPWATPTTAEHAADLMSIAEKMVQASFDAADAKYLAQRAYNTHRAKGAYEAKLRRGPRP
ncbi:MAG TPA: VWA domain-containing protein [Gemmatimonadaceae bacterium]|nr:VWA domain-containing protein [Gemmatimonadaceae bacterium]